MLPLAYTSLVYAYVVYIHMYYYLHRMQILICFDSSVAYWIYCGIGLYNTQAMDVVVGHAYYVVESCVYLYKIRIYVCEFFVHFAYR